MGMIEKRAGNERDLVEKKERPSSPFLSRIPLVADPVDRPPVFPTIVSIEGEPGAGYA